MTNYKNKELNKKRNKKEISERIFMDDNFLKDVIDFEQNPTIDQLSKIDDDKWFVHLFEKPQHIQAELDLESFKMLVDEYGTDMDKSAELIAEKYTKEELASIVVSLARAHVPKFQFYNQGAPEISTEEQFRRLLFTYSVLIMVEEGQAKNKRDACRILAKAGFHGWLKTADDDGELLYEELKKIRKQRYFKFWDSFRGDRPYSIFKKQLEYSIGIEKGEIIQRTFFSPISTATFITVINIHYRYGGNHERISNQSARPYCW